MLIDTCVDNTQTCYKGHCDTANKCRCQTGWEGDHCDKNPGKFLKKYCKPSSIKNILITSYSCPMF